MRRVVLPDATAAAPVPGNVRGSDRGSSGGSGGGSDCVSPRASAGESDRIAQAWAVLEAVLDPEVPALSICDLGIVRDVVEGSDGALEIVLTPTYSGCPATEVIEESALAALAGAGLGPASVRMQRAPAWTSDWISEAGRRKLQDYGIAAPGPAGIVQVAPLRFLGRRQVGAQPACPRCGSVDTECLSAFGSTACKALYRCRACREPFEYFKAI